MSGTVMTRMYVRAVHCVATETAFDYCVEWDHNPQGGVGPDSPMRPWTVCSIYRVHNDGSRKRVSLRDVHFGGVTAYTLLHPKDKYNHIMGERQSLRLALLQPFKMQDPIGEEHHPLPCDEEKLQRPYTLTRGERTEFWEHFNRVRAKLHKRRLSNPEELGLSFDPESSSGRRWPSHAAR